MATATKYFDKIIVFSPYQKELFKHNIPNNLKHIKLDNRFRILDILESLSFICSTHLIKEILKNIDSKFFKKLKICLVDVFKSSNLIRTINYNLKNLNINSEDTIFYSYWHDYKALALARMQKNNKALFISRAHSSDIFAFRSYYNYLPFKKFILSRLDCTFSISEQGKIELSKYTNGKNFNLKISRLGKNNTIKPNFLKSQEKYIICSCSHFNKIKRVHMIPKIIKEMNMSNIHWVHFGWGFTEYEQLVFDELKDASFTYEIKGKTENEEILDFYSENYVDLFINLSTHEGIPVSIMEALSAGIPVLATNVGATSEIVDEKCGFLVDMDINVNNLSNLISSFFNSSRKEIEIKRENAFRKWNSMYNAQNNYHNFYKEIIQMHVEKNS